MDITTIAELGTAGGTLILAVATFASIRSANRAARVSERALQVNLRPVLAPARPDNPPEAVMFGEGRVLKLKDGRPVVEREDGNTYMAIPLRNVGAGMAVLQGWKVVAGWRREPEEEVPAREEFRPQRRDLYIPPGDSGFWQGAVRGAEDEWYSAIEEGLALDDAGITVYILFADHEGGQPAVTRFGLRPRQDGTWFSQMTRHWNLEGVNPRTGD